MKTKLEAYFFHHESGSIFIDNLIEGPIRASKAGFDLVKIGMAFDPGTEELERRLEKRDNHLGIRYIKKIYEECPLWYCSESNSFKEIPF